MSTIKTWDAKACTKENWGCFPLVRSCRPKSKPVLALFWPVFKNGKSKQRAHIFPATTLQIPALWPTGAGELSSSDPWAGTFWPEPVLRTRVLHLRTDWSNQPDWTNGKRNARPRVFFFPNTWAIRYRVKSRVSWQTRKSENLGYLLQPQTVYQYVNSPCMDPMHKWRQFKYSFVYIQISPTSLILGNIFFWKLNSRTRLVGLISM